MDIGTLKKVQLQVRNNSRLISMPAETLVQTILNLCMALGFLVRFLLPNTQARFTTRCQAHGYATAEFEVTEERLGVYLPVRAPTSILYVY